MCLPTYLRPMMSVSCYACYCLLLSERECRYIVARAARAGRLILIRVTRDVASHPRTERLTPLVYDLKCYVLLPRATYSYVPTPIMYFDFLAYIHTFNVCTYVSLCMCKA